MKRTLILVAVGVVCAVSLACQPGAAGLSDQDKAVIRQMDETLSKALMAEKPDWDTTLAAYYADDARWMMSNMPAAEGRAAIKAAISSFPPMKDFKMTEVSLEGSGDIAYRHYTYVMTFNPPGAAAPVTDRGNGIEVFKKQADGTWRVIRDIGTSDLPVPGLSIPTGEMAATASEEVKKLGDLVGRWQITGTAKEDPQSPAQPVTLSLDCQWFASGLEVVCAYTGTSAGQPFQEADIFSYDSTAKSYPIYAVTNHGGAMAGKLAFETGKWIQTWNLSMEGKPVNLRLVVSNPTAEEGTWTSEMSVGGGPRAVLGEGKYVKAK
jgi:ketosteroid isomerase-like protein